MPDVSLDGMSIDELSDLLAYLASQGGPTPASAATRPAGTPRASKASRRKK